MTIYTVQMPSGEVLDIEGPSGASERDLFNAGQQHLTARKQQAGQMALEGMSGTQKFLAGVGQGMTDLYRGAKQRLGFATEADAADARARDQALLGSGAGIAGSIVGQAAPFVAASLVPGANTLLGAGALGGVAGALQPTVEGEDPAVNAVKHGMFGAGGHLLGRAVFSPVANRNPQPRQDLIDIGKQKYGIDFPASTQTGSKPLAYLESQLAVSPGGGRMADVLQGSNEQFSRAVMREAGAPGELATQAALETAKKATQNAYAQIWKNNLVQADNQLISDLVTARAMADRVLTPPKVRVVENQINNILDKVQPGGTIPGDVYQMFLRPEIRAAIKGDSALYEPLRRVQRALDDAAERSVGKATADELKALHYQYATQKKLEPAVRQAEARGGTFSPSAVKVAAGDMRGNVGELAKIGQLLREPPQSGTVPRAVAQYMLSGVPAGVYGYSEGGASGAASGALAGGVLGLLAPAVSSRVIANPAVQRYLSSGMLSMSPGNEAVTAALLRGGAMPLPLLLDASK